MDDAIHVQIEIVKLWYLNEERERVREGGKYYHNTSYSCQCLQTHTYSKKGKLGLVYIPKNSVIVANLTGKVRSYVRRMLALVK